MRMMTRDIFLGAGGPALSLLFAGAVYGQGSVTPQGAVIIDDGGQDDGAEGDDAQASSRGAVRLRVVTWNVEGGQCGKPRPEVLTVVAEHLTRLKRDEGLDVV